MKSRTTGVPRGQKGKNIRVEGPNWILIAGGAFLSTLSIRLGYRLKQTLDSKQQANATSSLKGNEKPFDRRRAGVCHMHSNMYSFAQDEDGCFNCISGNEGIADLKHHSGDQMLLESDGALPLVTVPGPEFTKENGVMWVSSPDRLELPPKPFHHSNCSDSPCVSESGSDIFSKREVILKLRQQLKRRDDMIMEMQDQILEMQNSLNDQLAHSANLQSQLDEANRDLFDSEREIQRLRKAIADHCVNHAVVNGKPSTGPTWPSEVTNGKPSTGPTWPSEVANGKPSTAPIWPSELANGHANGYLDGDSDGFVLSEKGRGGRGDGERIDMLKREVGELKDVIEGKEFLLQSYKEQKTELSMKIKELQRRLDSQLPNIL